MSIQNLDFGTAAANDGESLFTAFTKLQANFVEIYGRFPASTDKAVARFSGTSGALQNSGVTVSDANLITAPGGFATTSAYSSAGVTSKTYANAFDPYNQISSNGSVSGLNANPIGTWVFNQASGTSWAEIVGMWNTVELNTTAGSGNILVYDGQSQLNGTATAGNFLFYNAELVFHGSGNVTGEVNGYACRNIRQTAPGSGHVTGPVYGFRLNNAFCDASASSWAGTFIEDPTSEAVGTTAAFFTNIAAGTNKLAFYASGTAPSLFGGAVGVGVTPSASGVTAEGIKIRTAGYSGTNTWQVVLDSTAAYNASPFGGFFVENKYTSGGAYAGMGGFGIGKENAVDGDLLAYGAIYIRNGGGVVEGARVTSAPNFKIGGTAARGTTEGTKQFVLYDGTPPVGTLANGVSFYSASGECRVMNSSGASNQLSGAISSPSAMTMLNATAVPAGGTAGAGLKMSSTSNLGLFFGSGAPTLAAAQGSYYLRTDGSSTSTRGYINTDGNTTWTAVTTAA